MDILKTLFEVKYLHGNDAMHTAIDYMIDNYSKNVELPYYIKNNNGEIIITIDQFE